MVNVRNLGFGGTGIPDAMPQAIAELQGMRLSVVTGAAAGTVVPVTGMDPEDHIGAVVNLTDLVDVALNTITIGARNASATITCLTTAVDGDKVTVNGKAYTFKDVVVHTSYNTPPGVVPIDITPSGSNPNEMASRLAKAIMSGDSTLTASVAVGTPTIVTVKVRQPGTAGNSYTLAETGNAVTISGATFTGGTAAGSSGFSSSVSLAAKKLLVLWYDKAPGAATNPLLFRALGALEESGSEVEYELSVTELEPESAEVGDESFTLTVRGTGFGPDSKIVFNGYEEPTTFVSPQELTTGVNMAVWTGPSEPLPVKVRTGYGDDSNEMMFQFYAEGTGPASPPEGQAGRRGPGGPGKPGGPGRGSNLTIKPSKGAGDRDKNERNDKDRDDDRDNKPDAGR
jgi:hypothetical protein